jgi:hypothetical protein
LHPSPVAAKAMLADIKKIKTDKQQTTHVFFIFSPARKTCRAEILTQTRNAIRTTSFSDLLFAKLFFLAFAQKKIFSFSPRIAGMQTTFFFPCFIFVFNAREKNSQKNHPACGFLVTSAIVKYEFYLT